MSGHTGDLAWASSEEYQTRYGRAWPIGVTRYEVEPRRSSSLHLRLYGD